MPSPLRGLLSPYHTRCISCTVRFQANTAPPTVPLSASQYTRGLCTILNDAGDYPKNGYVMNDIALDKFCSRLTMWDTYWTVVHNLSIINTANYTATTSTATTLTATTTTPNHKNGLRTAPIIGCNIMNHVQIPLSAVVCNLLLTAEEQKKIPPRNRDILFVPKTFPSFVSEEGL